MNPPSPAAAATSDQDLPEGIRSFIEAINGHDLTALETAMAADHVFTDGLGCETRGREAMLRAWRKYFALFPDYRIVVERAVVGRDRTALFGRASGTLAAMPSRGQTDPLHWSIPAAWEAEVDGHAVRAWRVYADTGPVRSILALRPDAADPSPKQPPEGGNRSCSAPPS